MVSKPIGKAYSSSMSCVYSQIIKFFWLLVIVLFSSPVFSISITANNPLSIGQTAVNLSATITENSGSLSTKLIYGTSPELLSFSSVERNYFVANQPLDISVFISGLNCGTTYYYQFEATNIDGVMKADIAQFTTNVCIQLAAQVQTLEATNITPFAARVNGSIATGADSDFIQVRYYFDYGLTGDYGETSPVFQLPPEGSTQRPLKQDIFNLSCNTTYHYRLVVEFEKVDQTVDTHTANDMTLMTEACKSVEIAGLGALSVGRNTVSLGGTILLSLESAIIQVIYGLTKENLVLETPQKSLEKNSPSFREYLADLDCETEYFYQFVVSDSLGETRSDVKSFVTGACFLPPSATTLQPLEISQTSAKLSASVVANNEQTEVYFSWGVTSNTPSSTERLPIGAGTLGQLVSIFVDGLVCGQEYFFKVIAENINGEIIGDLQSFNTLPCDEPSTSPEGDNKFVVSAGSHHSVTLGRSGTIITWGDNQLGQLGAEITDFSVVDGVRGGTGFSELMYGFESVSAGGAHTLVLHEQGDVYSFGNNERGQLGVESDEANANYPVYVISASLSSDKVVAVSAGNAHSLVLTANGFVYAWGDNLSGQLLDSTITRASTPVLINGLTDISAISAGSSFNIALKRDKSLLGWGDNTYGQLGNDNFQSIFSLNTIATSENISAISAGQSHVLALTETGKVLSWGRNNMNQLGHSTEDLNSQPTLVRSTSGVSTLSNVIQVAAGQSHSLALLENGTVMAWGSNQFGQLGVAVSAEVVEYPEFVINADNGAILQNINYIAAGDSHSIAVNENGEIFSWGSNAKGQLNGDQSSDTFAELRTNINEMLSLSDPYLAVDVSSIRLQAGQGANVRVRLSSAPVEATNVAAQLQGVDAILQQGELSVFAPSNWQEGSIISFAVNDFAEVGAGDLVISANGYNTISIPIEIVGGEAPVPRQVVGSVSKLELVMLCCLVLGFIVVSNSRRSI